MANFQKFGKSAVGHLAAHYERWKVKDPETGKEEYVKFGNQEIDVTRTHLNYNLGPEREMGQVEFIRQRISEVRCLNRDDVKILCSCVVTLPKENEYGEKMEYTDDQIRDFFKEAYEQLRDKHGEENVVSCYVHMDETTPHMHFAFVPVVQDLKRGDLKVSAKEAINQNYLRQFHPDLQRRMDERFGVGFFPVLNGNTDGGNRTIVQLKTERAIEDLTVAENDLFYAKLDLEDLQKESKSVQTELRAASEELSATKQEADKLKGDTLRMVDKLQAGKEILSRMDNKQKDMEREETSLRGSVALLRDEKSKLMQDKMDLEKSVPELREAIQAAREELAILNTAIKRKNEEGERQWGWSNWDAAVAQAKADKANEKKENLLAKFAEFLIEKFPAIRDLWQQFQRDQQKAKKKMLSKDEWNK